MDILYDFTRITMLSLLGLSGLIGMLAVVSPTAFAAVAAYGSRVVYTGAQTRLDRWVDIDQYVIEHARIFGILVIGTEAFIWYLSGNGPEVYSKSILLVIVGISLSMGIVALAQMLRQKQLIDSNLAEARTDPLTGLANRRAFDSELSRRLTQRQRQGKSSGLVILDIDNFKTFNDQFGHLMGDTILTKIAGALVETVGSAGMVARLGGDELAVLLPGFDLAQTSEMAEHLRLAVYHRPIHFEDQEHRLTVSLGLAEAQVDDDETSLMKRADSALYAAKQAGRNCSYRHGGPEPAVPTPCGEE